MPERDERLIRRGRTALRPRAPARLTPGGWGGPHPGGPSVGRGSSRSSSPGGRRDRPTSGLPPGARGVRRRQRRVSRRPRPEHPGGL